MFIPKFENKKERNIFYAKTSFTVFAGLALLYLLLPLMTSARVEHFVNAAGPFGPLIIISYFVLSDVVAPIAGSPGIVLSVGLYGLMNGLVMAYVASIISSIINFWISRTFGRTLVKRFAGKHAITQIDHYTAVFGTRTLILGRLFGYPVFEIISYAAGLTNISFRKYMIITILCSAVPAFTIKSLFFYANINSPSSVILWVSILNIVGVVFAYFTNTMINALSGPALAKVTVPEGDKKNG